METNDVNDKDYRLMKGCIKALVLGQLTAAVLSKEVYQDNGRMSEILDDAEDYLEARADRIVDGQLDFIVEGH